MSIAAQFERAPDNVGATACRHDLVAGRNERRAHDWRVFATTPAAVALLEIADERSVLEGEGQTWLERQLDWFREIIAEVIVDLVGEPENFSGIENIFWIERALVLAHDIQYGIFDKCDRFRRTDTAGQEREPGLAHGPNEIHFVRVAANLRAQPKIAGLQVRK